MCERVLADIYERGEGLSRRSNVPGGRTCGSSGLCPGLRPAATVMPPARRHARRSDGSVAVRMKSAVAGPRAISENDARTAAVHSTLERVEKNRSSRHRGPLNSLIRKKVQEGCGMTVEKSKPALLQGCKDAASRFSFLKGRCDSPVRSFKGMMP